MQRLLTFALLFSAYISFGQTYIINNNWSFIKDETDSLLPKELDGIPMQSINLPHTWNTVDAHDDEPGYYRGTGWYKHNFYVSPINKGNICYLYFEAVNQVAEIYVNNQLAGKHKGGYTAFVVDITTYLEHGKQNTLVVKANNKHNPMIPPLSADYTFFGGIYRDVYLVVKEPIHFDINNLGCQGTYINPVKRGKRDYNVQLKSKIKNGTPIKQKINLSYRITKNNNEIARLEKEVTLKPGSVSTIENSLLISNPELWSPDNPELYMVESAIFHDGDQVDVEFNNIGFRNFEFNTHDGVLLNGQSFKLHGVNRHQDYGDEGWAVSNKIHEADMELIKNMGFNFLRTAHYPQDNSLLNACDKLGLIVWEEIPVVNEITMDQEFYSICDTMLREMILQHYNHPSIFLWGYMNEIFINEGDDKNGKAQDKRFAETVKLAQHLNTVAKKLDETRATSMACEYKSYYNSTGLANIPDVVGWNLYFGWYYEQLSDLTRFLNAEHDKYPHRPIIVSEYGAGADPRICSDNPEAFDFSLEYQNIFISSYVDQFKRLGYLSGASIWVFNDFSSESRGDAVPHVNSKGLVGRYRDKKEIYYSLTDEIEEKAVIPINKPQLLNFSDASDTDTLGLLELPRPIGLSIKNNQKTHGELSYAINLGADKSVYNTQDHTIFIAAKYFGDLLNINDGNKYMKKTWTGYITGSNQNILKTDFDPMYQTYLTNIKTIKIEASEGRYQFEFYYIKCQEKWAETKIAINGDVVLNILAHDETGAGCVAQKDVVFYNNLDKNLVISFGSESDETRLSGLKIVKIE